MDLEQIADRIEELDLMVSDEDFDRFQELLNEYLGDNDLTIKEAVMEIGEGNARRLLTELERLRY